MIQKHLIRCNEDNEMKRYIINEIQSDGYERFAIIEEIGQSIKINVHFFEYDEYLENDEQSRKRKKEMH